MLGLYVDPQELCQCFYQLKSFEAELVDASEKSDEGEDDDVDRTSNSEQEDAAQHLNDDGSAADDDEQQTTSVKQLQSQASHDALQEKIKDMINVAHVSHLYSLDICYVQIRVASWKKFFKFEQNWHIMQKKIMTVAVSD